MSQWQHVHSLPSCTYYGTYVPSSPYTHPEYCAYSSCTLLTQMCDTLNNWLINHLVFLSVHHWTFPISLLHSSLVVVNLQVHRSLVRLSKYLRTLLSAWSASCLRSLRASSIFYLISTLLALNNRLTASTSLRLLPCQFLLRLFLATYLCCCFCVFFGMSQHQIPVPACWLNFLVLCCLFLIMFSCSSR